MARTLNIWMKTPLEHIIVENSLEKSRWENINITMFPGGFVWKCWVNIPNEIAI